VTTQPVNLSFVVAQTPNCSQSVTFALSPASAFVALSGVTVNSGSIQINGATLSDHNMNPYAFTLSASISTVTASSNINVYIKNPCSMAVFSISSIPTFNADLAVA